MLINSISRKEVIIDLSGEKSETKYLNIKNRYHEIVEACEKVVNLSINLSYSLIEQETLDLIIHDLFYMPIIEQDKERVFHHKYFDLRKVTIQVESSQLTNVQFISNFLHYHNVISLELSCNSSMLAYSFLNVTKESAKIDNILCENYFSKYFGAYSIKSSSFFADSAQIWEDIYDQIEDLKVSIQQNTFETMLGRLVRLSMIKKLEIELLSLNNLEKNTKTLIQQLSSNCKQLSKLILKIYDDQLLPPIKIEIFQQKCQLEIQYMSSLSHISISQLLQKINQSMQHQQVLQIPSFVNLKEGELKLDFFNRLFSDEENGIIESQKNLIDDKENDIKELMRFLSKAAQELKSLEMNFSNSQVFSPSRWLEMLKILFTNYNLKFVKLSCACISPQLSAYSLAKFVKSGKIRAQVNNSFLKCGILELQLHQISHNIMNTLMAGNCLREGASYFHKLSIYSGTIIGEFQPFSTYFKTANHSFKSLSIQITEEDPDLMQLLVSAVQDSLALRKTTDEFSLSQSYKEIQLLNCFSFLLLNHPDTMRLQIQQKYGIFSILSKIRVSENNKLYGNLVSTLLLKLLFLRNYDRNVLGALSFQDFMKSLKLLQQVWNFQNTCIQENNLLFQLSVFFKIIAPYIPLNPYMLASDLYYD